MGVPALQRATLCVLSLLIIGVLGLDPESKALSISDLPPCGIKCLFLTVPSSGCDFSDIECQCKNDGLARTLSACMLANCTMEDTLDTAKAQADLCHLPDTSKTRDVQLYTIIVFTIAVTFVVLRIAGKVLAKRLAVDDWIIMTAMLLTMIPCGCVLSMAGMGFGEHLWNLHHGELLRCLRFFFISWSTYVIILGLIKVSLVMFYLEIFQSRRFRISCWIVLAYISLNTLVIFLLTIFVCNPVKSFWDRNIKGRCMDINALAYANSACAIAQDVILLVLPLVSIRKLNMKRNRKIAVGLMFSIGTFGCITTIIRLHSLLTFKISIDPTWDYVPVTIWTELELACGFACVSLPSIRILLAMILPKKFFSQFTHRSRSRSTPAPRLDIEQHQGPLKKAISWMQISVNTNSSRPGTESQSYGRSLWSSITRSQPQMEHRRLESAMGSHNGSRQHSTIPHTPYREIWAQEPTELLQVPRAQPRPSCPSCGSQEAITALPRIGCLPDGSYSKLDLSHDFRGLDHQWSRD